MNPNPISTIAGHRYDASLSAPFLTQNPVAQAVPRVLPKLDPHAGRKALAVKRATWATLKLRQAWADEPHMRKTLKASGVRINDNTEPASPARVKAVLRRIGIAGPQVMEAVGTNLTGFLKLNPCLPLWAAVALILEATGNFNPEDPLDMGATASLPTAPAL